VLSRACVALILLCGGVPSVLAGERPPADAAAVRAGAASVELRIPPGTPLGGYGSLRRRLLVPDLFVRHRHAFWLRPSEGVRDPLKARALVLATDTVRVLWVSADLIAVDAALVRDVTRRLETRGLRYSAVIVSASHTHSGPGAFVDSTLFEVMVMDRLDAEVREAILEGIVTAASRAEARKTVARVGAGRVAGPPLQRSRLDLPLDSSIEILKLAAKDGRPIAVVWNYAIHGTMLGPANLHLSGDVMGLASLDLERTLGVPSLFVNGAEADVSPRRHGAQAATEGGRDLARIVGDAWPRIPAQPTAVLATARERVDLRGPSVSIRNCVGRWVPPFLRVPLGSALPRSADLTAVALADAAWVTIPGELQTELGTRVKDAGRAHFRSSFVAGLSNGYLGYFLTPGAYDRTVYVACASLYGEEAGERIAVAAATLLDRLGARRSTRARAPTRPTRSAPGGGSKAAVEAPLDRAAEAARRASRDVGRERTSSARPCCGGSRLW
jgi:hypothetical protein